MAVEKKENRMFLDKSKSEKWDDIIGDTLVIPIVTIDDTEDAVPLAEALVAGGLPVIEVLLRTDAALEAIERIATSVREARVGAGTILYPEQFSQAKEVGAHFVVSPGAPSELVSAAMVQSLPWLPGAITPTEIHGLFLKGFTFLKFFPSVALGIDYFKELLGPYQEVSFCPTGGINGSNAAVWLSTPGIRCVGGIWPAPTELIRAKKFKTIESLARKAASLRR